MKEKGFLNMEKFMRASFKTMKQKEKEFLNMQMGMFTKASLK